MQTGHSTLPEENQNLSDPVDHNHPFFSNNSNTIHHSPIRIHPQLSLQNQNQNLQSTHSTIPPSAAGLHYNNNNNNNNPQDPSNFTTTTTAQTSITPHTQKSASTAHAVSSLPIPVPLPVPTQTSIGNPQAGSIQIPNLMPDNFPDTSSSATTEFVSQHPPHIQLPIDITNTMNQTNIVIPSIQDFQNQKIQQLQHQQQHQHQQFSQNVTSQPMIYIPDPNSLSPTTPINQLHLDNVISIPNSEEYMASSIPSVLPTPTTIGATPIPPPPIFHQHHNPSEQVSVDSFNFLNSSDGPSNSLPVPSYLHHDRNQSLPNGGYSADVPYSHRVSLNRAATVADTSRTSSLSNRASNVPLPPLTTADHTSFQFPPPSASNAPPTFIQAPTYIPPSPADPQKPYLESSLPMNNNPSSQFQFPQQSYIQPSQQQQQQTIPQLQPQPPFIYPENALTNGQQGVEITIPDLEAPTIDISPSFPNGNPPSADLQSPSIQIPPPSQLNPSFTFGAQKSSEASKPEREIPIASQSTAIKQHDTKNSVSLNSTDSKSPSEYALHILFTQVCFFFF